MVTQDIFLRSAYASAAAEIKAIQDAQPARLAVIARNKAEARRRNPAITGRMDRKDKAWAEMEDCSDV